MYIALFIMLVAVLPFVALAALKHIGRPRLGIPPSLIVGASLSMALIVIVPALNCFAQSGQQSLLKQVIQQDQAAVDAIAMYPPATRKDIFIACEYPEIIVRLNTMQKNTNDMFKQLLAPYSQDEQDKIYDLTRYPDLIAEMSEPFGSSKSTDQLMQIANKYPEHIRPIAIAEEQTNPQLLDTIDQQNRMYESQFNDMLNGYPADADSAFTDLIAQPEILSLLSDNMQLTVVVGDVYKKHPDHVLHKADSLNAVLTQQNSQETSDWQQNMNSDTQAQSQYEQAAQDYAQDNGGYTPDESSTPLDPAVATVTTEPYNWWFGYPDWYPYSYWDPYPYWFDWGFYYGPGHRAVFFGCPSPHFMDWYFYHPENHYKYSHLSNVYYNYYSAHRANAGYNPICRSVDQWRTQNGDIVTADWDKDPANRERLFKEYGRMETDRAAYNKKNPQHPVDHAAYLQMNPTKYRSIAVAQGRQVPPRPAGSQKAAPEPQAPAAKPYWKVPDSYKAPVNADNNAAKPQDNVRTAAQIHVVPATQPVISTQMRNANQIHQSAWQQIRPQPKPERSAPPPRQDSPPPSSGGRGRH